MKKWTEEEIKYLIENYPNKGGSICAEFLGRTYQSVTHKANKLGLKVLSKNKPAHNRKTHEQYENQLEKHSVWSVVEQYIDAHTPILHMCSKGHEVIISPANVLNNKGCKFCSDKFKRSDAQYKLELHGRQFTNIEPYINRFTPILHRCIEGHEWKALPSNIVRKGSGCPSCAKYGFDINKPGWVYYVKLTKGNEIYYKIGITNKENLSDRFKADRNLIIDILDKWYFDKGQDAYDTEQDLLNQYKEHRQNISGFLILGGNTELFEFDVLGLEKQDG